MRLLLDTHVFLWYLTADSRLPDSFRSAIQDPTNDVFLSAASVWEVAIKYALGKLPLPAPPQEFIPLERERHRIASLPIEEGAIAHLANLPSVHRDPFDRMLVAQSLQHDLTILTLDSVLKVYPAKIMSV
jgi:PIN domain nuclease of toxin-antitoxin system